MLPGVFDEDVAVVRGEDGWAENAPPAGAGRGVGHRGDVLVVVVTAWCSRCRIGLFGRDFGDGGAGGGFVDDGFVGGERGDEGLDGEVVDGAG